MPSFTTRPELCGTFGAVASTHWIATAVGMKLLEAGGNAFDAAAATGFVLQIVEPHLNGPGGDAPILVARANDDIPTVICGQGGAPAAATLEKFAELGLDLIPATGLLTPCIPGAFGAWLTMLRDFGTKPLRDILEPAIHYAIHGHPLLSSAANTIASVAQLFRDEWTTSAATFLRRGEIPQAGALFANPQLGAFLQRIVDHSEQAGGSRERQIEAALAFWYEGEVAETIDRFCRDNEVLDGSGRRHRGLLTGEDMAGWRPPVERPLSVDQGDYRLFKCGAWSQGPVLLQSVKLLSGFDLASLDPGSAEFVHLVTETLKLSMADRDAWYGDSDDCPIDDLLSEDYLSERRSLVGQGASDALRPGSPGGREPKLPRVRRRGYTSNSAAGGGEPTMAEERKAAAQANQDCQRGDTCHVDVVDRWGNMVSATPSGGWLQSNPVMPGLGFALGTRMQMFWLEAGLPNSLAPGKRPRTTLTPSMAYREGKPYLAFGTPGGDQQDQWSLLLWLYHTVYQRPLQASIETPAFHTDHLLASFWPREIVFKSLVMESRFDTAAVERLRTMGHDVSLGGPWSEGRLSACAIDRQEHGTYLRAGANPRGMQGYAIAR